jgi:hypothetical protein
MVERIHEYFLKFSAEDGMRFAVEVRRDIFAREFSVDNCNRNCRGVRQSLKGGSAEANTEI